MNTYIYDGPVKVYDVVTTNRWKGMTVAPSEKKARSNLAYQYRKRTNRSSNCKVTFTGKIEVIFGGHNGK